MVTDRGWSRYLTLLAAVLALVSAPLSAGAQPTTGKMPRVGALGVTSAAGDAVAGGLVASLARPGGNITGSTFFGPELSAKRLEMLKGAVPHLARVAVLVNPGSNYGIDFETVKRTATALNVELFEAPAGPRGSSMTPLR